MLLAIHCTSFLKPYNNPSLAKARGSQLLIIWTDCDREGENIGAEIESIVVSANRNIRVKRARFSEVRLYSNYPLVPITSSCFELKLFSWVFLHAKSCKRERVYINDAVMAILLFTWSHGIRQVMSRDNAEASCWMDRQAEVYASAILFTKLSCVLTRWNLEKQQVVESRKMLAHCLISILANFLPNRPTST